MIERIYHLTSRTNWGKIRDQGMLQPMSSLTTSEMTSGLPRLFWPRKFLVGIPVDSIKNWKDSELFEEVKKQAAWGWVDAKWEKPSEEEVVCLEVPVLSTRYALVREHVYLTRSYADGIMPGAFADVEMARMDSFHTPVRAHIDFWNELHRSYQNSGVRLKDYRGDFKIPELWLPQKTSINLVNKVESLR